MMNSNYLNKQQVIDTMDGDYIGLITIKKHNFSKVTEEVFEGTESQIIKWLESDQTNENVYEIMEDEDDYDEEEDD